MDKDKKQMDNILEELNSDDPEIQDNAIKKLETIGDNQSIIELVKCLDDNKWRQAKGFDPNWRGPQGERLQGRNIYEPINYMAAKSLARIIPEPPVSPSENQINLEHIKKWKQWWNENKNHYIDKKKGTGES